MRTKPIFKFLCTLTLWFYSCAVIQAGQVITKTERDWAKKALDQETQLGTLDSSQSLAVLYFHNKTGQKGLNALQKGLALMLITDLSKLDNIFVVERIRLQALLDEMDLGKSGLVDEATAPRIGKLLKAYYVVGGDIEEGSGERLVFDSRLLDVPFENTSVLPPAIGSVDELIRMEKDLLFSIVDQLNLILTPAQEKELQVPLSLSLAALLALFAGIDYSDAGNYDKAAEMYNRAMAEDSGLELAQTSLQELKDMGLIVSQDLTAVEPAADAAAAEGGVSWGTIGAVALGIAVIGGGIALLASDSDDGDSGGSSGGGDGPSVSASKLTALCATDSIVFTFSEAMKPQGTVVAAGRAKGEISYDWNSPTTFIASWSSLDYSGGSCSPAATPFTLTFSGFVTEDDVALSDTSFDITTTL